MKKRSDGYLALKHGEEAIPIQVCYSAGGYYIGTMDPEDGTPFSRESAEYYGSFAEAQDALYAGTWTQRPNP